MSASQAIAPYLPFLRRYARALTGSQSSGDAYVAAALEALIEDTSVLDNSSSPRVALYQLFSKIWNSVVVNAKVVPEGSALPAEQRLSQITPRPRQAFLLVALEGFSEADAASILDVDIPTLRQLVEESGRELAAEIATDVMIIEDEPFIAMDLEGSGGKPRAPRARRGTDPCGGGDAGQVQAPRPDPGRHSARRRLVRASTRSTNCCGRSRCRSSSSPPIRSASSPASGPSRRS